MSLAKAYKSFDNEFAKTWNKYVELHKALDKFRGIEITEKNVGTINKIVIALQDCYAELHASLNWVLERHKLCVDAVHEYKKFMDDIKAGGAQPENANGTVGNQSNEQAQA